MNQPTTTATATAAPSRAWERLSALDASFLAIEGDCTPMHIAAILTLERAPFADERGRIRLGALRSFVESRLGVNPKLRRVVREVPGGIGRPIWVDDPHFDIADHIRLLELPAPGDQQALEELVEQVVMSALDRTRPLWEWWVIDGLEGDRIALVEKMHHAVVDGVSGAQLLLALTDLGDLLAPPSTEPWIPQPAPSALQVVADALREQVAEPVRLADAAVSAVREGRSGLRRLASVVTTATTALLPQRLTIASSLGQHVGRRRHLRTLAVPLDDVKRIAHAHDTKVNDVALTLVSGGLRALVQSRGESVRGVTLNALVPEDVRRPDEQLALGNRVSGFFAPLPVHEADAHRTLECIRESMRHKRSVHEDETASAMLAGAEHLPYGLLKALTPLVHQQPWVNVVVTNVPGPPMELTLMGSRILSMAPLVPLARNLGLGVAVLSYAGTLAFTVNACRDACPDIDVMMAGMRSTFEALEASTQSTRRSAAAPRTGSRAPAGRRLSR